MLRAVAAIFAVSVICIAAFTSVGPQPAAGDGAVASFAPLITPAPSPTVVQTALPAPISRPEDARGVTQTTAPYASATAFSPPPAPPALWLSTSSSFAVPCELHGDRIFVSVVVDGRSDMFLLDSSAPFSEIDAAAAPSHDSPIVLHTLQIGELRFNALRAGVTRIRAASSAYFGRAADGVLGQELFSRFPVRIDYRGCTVTVYRDAQAAVASPPPAVVVELRMVNGQPQIDAHLGSDGSVPLIVSTGSDADIDITQAMATSAHLMFSAVVPELRRWLPGSGEHHGSTARDGPATVGSFVAERPLIGIIDDGGRAGYLGNGFLQNFSVLLDEPEFKLALDPVSPMRSPYDKSGAWLVVRNGAVAVKTVLPDSPADKAGLSPGDRIIAINGQAVGDLDGARGLFAGSGGSTVTVVYEHGGRQRTTTIALKTLL